MSGRLREIARQTVAIAESGRYANHAGDEILIGDEVRAAVAGTRLYLPDADLETAAQGSPAIEVTHESTLMAARRVVADAFAAALRQVSGVELVVFAVRDGLPETPVYRAFRQRFDRMTAQG